MAYDRPVREPNYFEAGYGSGFPVSYKREHFGCERSENEEIDINHMLLGPQSYLERRGSNLETNSLFTSD